MIFKQHFIDLILSSKKTQTRRPNKGYYVVGKTYAIQPCRICKGIENYRIMIDNIWLEGGGISREDALAEGGYVPAEFEKVFRELYPDMICSRWAFKFHVVEVPNENQ